MRILRVLTTLVLIGFIGAEFIAKLPFDHVPSRFHRFGGNADAIGTDIGDQTHRARFANIDAFIELLHHLHGFGGRKIELTARFLLQA